MSGEGTFVSLNAPRAIITGVTGQDGAYLARHLVDRGYKVLGVARVGSDSWRLAELHLHSRIELVHVDLTRSQELRQLVGQVQPREVYHLAAFSSVTESFQNPLICGEGDALITLHLLESIRVASPRSRFFFAASSEMFGNGAPNPQNEETRLAPRSPYACAKAYGHHLAATYRQAYGIFACSGILFNHESPLRCTKFVTRKITSSLAKIKLEDGEPLRLGNLESRRDWGYALEYTEAMTLILQADAPEDFVLATGKVFSVRQFCEFAAQACDFDLIWEREGDREVGVDRSTGKILIESEASWHRSNDIPYRLGDPARAREKLGWQAQTLAPELACLMVRAEFGALASERPRG